MIGLLPAGGHAVRMGGIPKMLLPTPDGTLLERLCAQIQQANPRRLLVLATNGADFWLREYADVQTGIFVGRSATMSAAVLLARQHIGHDETVLFGMPDTYIEDAAAFPKLARALERGAEIAVGVFRTRPGQHRKVGMVKIYSSKITSVVDKPTLTDLTYCWGVLAWKPIFWDYLRASDPHVGYALPHAIADGLRVRAVPMAGNYWDCGTVNEYFELIRHLTETPCT